MYISAFTPVLSYQSISSKLATLIVNCKNTCKFTPKGMVAQLFDPFWCEITLVFLLKQFEANTSSVMHVKYFYLLLLTLSCKQSTSADPESFARRIQHFF